MIGLSFLLAAGLASASPAAPDGAPATAGEPAPLDLSFSTLPPAAAECSEGEDPDDQIAARLAAARARAVARVTYADEADFVGHIESTEDGVLSILGRRVHTELAEITGGARADLTPGTLVRVVGQGRTDGSVEATRLGIWSSKDPTAVARLDREVREFKEKYWKKARAYDEPELTAYLQGIVDRLTPDYVPAGDRRFRIQVVRDPDLNAFALPDGTVVVHSGIITRMESEAQLAAVLAHEMAHITQRHSLRSLEKSTEQMLLGWGSMLAAIALGATGQGDAAQGVRLMSSAWLSGYSRYHEDEADRVGMRYLYLAGYDVRQAPEVWKTFELLYGVESTEANFFYGSHSTARAREHNLSHEVWKAYEPSGLVGGRVGREDFLRRTAALVRENALLDLDRGNLAWAEWGLGRSLAVAPDDALTHVALGRLALKQGTGDALARAISAFRHATELDPRNSEAWHQLGKALERAGDRAGARQALERYLELAPDGSAASDVRRQLARL